jgi:serine/threonine protein kinase
MPGGFAETPESASPEQFAALGVDIRSDLYSLGVTPWVMLTGRPPFRGTPAELIYQHQHGALLFEQMKSSLSLNQRFESQMNQARLLI